MLSSVPKKNGLPRVHPTRKEWKQLATKAWKHFTIIYIECRLPLHLTLHVSSFIWRWELDQKVPAHSLVHSEKNYRYIQQITNEAVKREAKVKHCKTRINEFYEI